jgi:opacity protein-like surface antigen
MRFSLRSLILSSAALCASTAFAANQVQMNVPFNFVVKNHVYRAGTYKVEVEPEKFIVILSSSQEPTASLMWLVGPSSGKDQAAKVRLTFDVIGSTRSTTWSLPGSLANKANPENSRLKAPLHSSQGGLSRFSCF